MASPPTTSRLSMKPPSLPANYVSRNSKKRMSSGSGSSFMDPEVIEIPPPVHRTFRSKQKQSIIQEVIDIDEDEEPSDVMILGIKVDVKAKGKASINNSGSLGNQTKDSLGVTNKADPLKNSGPRSRDLLHADSDFSYDEEYFGFVSDMMDDEVVEMIQAHFDSVGLPTGVEATIPWFPGFSPSKKKAFKGSSSSVDNGMNPFCSFGSSKPSLTISDTSLQNPVNASVHSASLGQPSSFPLLSPSLCPKSENKPAVSKHGGDNLNHPFRQSSLDGFSANANLHTSGASMLPFGVEPPVWGFYAPPVHTLGAAGSSSFPDIYNAMSNSMLGSHVSWPFESDPFNVNHNLKGNFFEQIDEVDVSPQEMTDIRNQKVVNEEDINKYKLFKKFDTVEDFSDHHYSNIAVKQPSKNWAKKIQDEWRILKNDLPDTIFVRVCESRMDLLRAVIIGAEGTPYHDGLFFFDVLFPASYPKGPPNVYYHSGGLRLNPNLYACGKVCLSLLNTWSGNKNEKWIPGTSTMLQVLVSIQALILNQKPYFNEPGYARSSGTPHGEIASHQYNEDTFILSLRTMMFTMRKPPKHFQDFVMGHFYHRAHDIMVACKAYLDGAQVGCLVKGGVQDVDEGDKSCSQKFKDSVAKCVNLLVKEFALLGVKDCEKFTINT